MGALEKYDLVLLGGAAVSGLVIVWGYLWQYIITVPVGTVLLTTLLSYYFQRRMHRDIRKTELTKMAVVEVLGPLHGELLKLAQTLENNERRGFLEMPNSDIWNATKLSYRYYLISENLRSRCGDFFLELDRLQIGEVTTRISKIARGIRDPLFPDGFSLLKEPDFRIERHDGGGIHAAWFWGLVFWKVMPRDQYPDKLTDVLIEGVNRVGGTARMTFTADNAREFTNRFLKSVFEESDRDPVIAEAREMHKKLQASARCLYDVVRDEIVRWVE